MVRALRKVHAALAPGGVLIDLRPLAGVELAGADGPLGPVDDGGMMSGYRAADDGLAELAREGLFAPVAGGETLYVERYDTHAAMVERMAGAERLHATPELIERAARATLPLEVRHLVALRVYRRCI